MLLEVSDKPGSSRAPSPNNLRRGHRPSGIVVRAGAALGMTGSQCSKCELSVGCPSGSPRGWLKLQQLQLSQPEPDGQPTESSHLVRHVAAIDREGASDDITCAV